MENKSKLISQALETKKPVSKPVSVSPNSNIQIVKNVRQQVRPSIVQARINALNTNSELETMKQFASSGDIYLTFGGVGDLMLLLGEAYQNNNGKIIFFANDGCQIFAYDFIKYFNVKTLVLKNIFGSNEAHNALQILKETNRLMQSAHLPDGLDYGDWTRNNDKYINRIITKTNWAEKIGYDEKIASQKTVVIALTGSYRKMHKQKFLTPLEVEAINKIYLDYGYTIYMTGSEADRLYYSSFRSPKILWMTNNKIFNYKNQVEMITFQKYLQIINSANECASVDTWLKTFTCLLGKPTKVFDNRYNNNYSFGTDSGDYIFLNTKLWKNMMLFRWEDFVENNGWL